MILRPVQNLQAFLPAGELPRRRCPSRRSLPIPTIVGLTSRGKTGHLVVFSTGNSLGLGPVREKELNGSCQRLGIDMSRCFALNLTDLQDDPHRWWPKGNISEIVKRFIDRFHIDLLITFDRGGISGHVNHKSLAVGIEHLVEHVERTPLTYRLSTVSALFEFSSIVDLVRTLVKFSPRLLRSLFSTILPFLVAPPNNHRALVVSSPFGYLQGLQAFHAHRSQMLWYRHFYTTFSRHVFINDLTQLSKDWETI